ncbi:hypothetical protein ACFE04_028736 [Oxalis oulophora]
MNRVRKQRGYIVCQFRPLDGVKTNGQTVDIQLKNLSMLPSCFHLRALYLIVAPDTFTVSLTVPSMSHYLGSFGFFDLGSHQNDVDSSSGRSLSGSFRKFKSGFSRSDPDESPGLSFDGSLRKSNSALSVQSISGISALRNTVHTSRRLLKGLKDCAKKLIDKQSFAHNLEDWAYQNTNQETFSSPFSIDELHKLDLALEGSVYLSLQNNVHGFICVGDIIGLPVV